MSPTPEAQREFEIISSKWIELKIPEEVLQANSNSCAPMFDFLKSLIHIHFTDKIGGYDIKAIEELENYFGKHIRLMERSCTLVGLDHGLKRFITNPELSEAHLIPQREQELLEVAAKNVKIFAYEVLGKNIDFGVTTQEKGIEYATLFERFLAASCLACYVQGLKMAALQAIKR